MNIIIIVRISTGFFFPDGRDARVARGRASGGAPMRGWAFKESLFSTLLGLVGCGFRADLWAKRWDSVKRGGANTHGWRLGVKD